MLSLGRNDLDGGIHLGLSPIIIHLFISEIFIFLKSVTHKYDSYHKKYFLFKIGNNPQNNQLVR